MSEFEFGGLWKHEKTQRAVCNEIGLGSATLLRLAFLGESDPKSPLGQESGQIIKNTKDCPTSTDRNF